MDMNEHRDRLLAFLESIARPGFQASQVVDDDENLVQAGLVDSFALIQIIFYLEKSYGLNLQKLGIDPADLVSVNGILAAVRRSAG